MVLTPMKRCLQIIGIYILCWILARLAFPPVRDLEFGPFLFLPCLMLSIGGAFTQTLRSAAGVGDARILAATIAFVAEGLGFWVSRPGSGAKLIVTAQSQEAFFRATFGLVLGLFALLPLILPSIQPTSGQTRLRSPGRWVAAGTVAMILFYRISNELLRGIPNEDRSLFVAGVEIHHYHQGLLVWILALTLASNPTLSRWTITWLLTGVGAGMVLDQATYAFIANCSDDAYFGLISYSGAIIGGAGLVWSVLRMSSRAMQATTSESSVTAGS